MNPGTHLTWLATAAAVVAGFGRPRRGRTHRRRGQSVSPRRRARPLGADAAAAALAVGVALLAGSPLLGVLVPVVWSAAELLRQRARDRARDRARAQAVPDLVDLFLLAASAGLTIEGSLRAVSERAPTPLRSDLLDACARLDRAAPLGHVLGELGRSLGPMGSPLTAALARAAGSGQPVVALLAPVGAAARDQRARAAQERARRLPVALLFPLAFCILPAAVVLAVVPVLVVSIGSLAP